jgi:hypothetical protein
VDVWIARGGEIISECPRDDIEGYARDGYFNPDDDYWHEGLTEWGRLDELLSPATWDAPAPENRVVAPKILETAAAPLPPHLAPWATSWEEQEAWRPPTRFRPPAPAVVAKIDRWFPRGTLRIGAIATGVLLALSLILWLSFRPTKEAPRPAPPYDLAADVAGRNEATNDLIARMNRLPTRLVPPANTYYDRLGIQIPDAPSELVVAISGAENVVDPDTLKTVSRTEFQLAAAYLHRRWYLRHYVEDLHNFINNTTTHTEKGPDHPVPPAIASVLGIETTKH